MVNFVSVDANLRSIREWKMKIFSYIATKRTRVYNCRCFWKQRGDSSYAALARVQANKISGRKLKFGSSLSAWQVGKGDIMGKLTTTCIIVVFCSANVIAAPAQTFTSLFSFDGTDGEKPLGGLVQGANGNFYGTTSQADGGAHGNNGTVFQITPDGTLTTVYTFCSSTNSSGLCLDGASPGATLMQNSNGNFYGTTRYGGSNVNEDVCPLDLGCGTVFEITPGGTLTTLHSFCSQPNCADGASPNSALIETTNGEIYGVAGSGGGTANCYTSTGCGTLFKITPAGEFSIVYRFCSLASCADGALPSMLLQAANGDIYGTATTGGANGDGTVFKLTLAGALTTVYSFCSLANCADGSLPDSLVQGANGDFYGTTAQGGADTTDGGGTIFKLTPAGKLTTLHSFCAKEGCDGFKEGNGPEGPLVQAANGDFYGLTYGGGNRVEAYCQGVDGGCGIVFEITPAGKLTTLYRFCSQIDCTDGANPDSGLLQVTGTLYGTTSYGGASDTGVGTVFSLVP
jgi:uncharacterized repeat protein (TIGR03803 family)